MSCDPHFSVVQIKNGLLVFRRTPNRSPLRRKNQETRKHLSEQKFDNISGHRLYFGQGAEAFREFSILISDFRFGAAIKLSLKAELEISALKILKQLVNSKSEIQNLKSKRVGQMVQTKARPAVYRGPPKHS
ncbi:MAG TPA: hypothetical protein VGB17_18485 [Pyrinomonadaceae bacterium]|jgi:hypothetical protein